MLSVLRRDIRQSSEISGNEDRCSSWLCVTITFWPRLGSWFSLLWAHCAKLNKSKWVGFFKTKKLMKMHFKLIFWCILNQYNDLIVEWCCKKQILKKEYLKGKAFGHVKIGMVRWIKILESLPKLTYKHVIFQRY